MAKKNKISQKDNTLIIVAILLVLLLLFGFGLGFGYMSGMMFFGPVFMALVLFLIVWLVVSMTKKKKR